MKALPLIFLKKKNTQQKILEIIDEIKKHRILTDFDRVYEMVLEQKKISSAEIAKKLGISKQRTEECAQILEEDKLVEIVFQTIGDEIIQVPEYKPAKPLPKPETKKVKKK